MALSKEVSVHPPDQLIADQGGKARFNCLQSAINQMRLVAIQWFMNGTLVENTTNVKTFFRAGSGAALIFSNLTLDFNMTSIHCRAKFQHEMVNSTNMPILFVRRLSGKY